MIPSSTYVARPSTPWPRALDLPQWICCGPGREIPIRVFVMQPCRRWAAWAMRASFLSWSGLRSMTMADVGRSGSKMLPAMRLSALENDIQSSRLKDGSSTHGVDIQGLQLAALPVDHGAPPTV